MQELIARIDAELPQTQCTRCGFPSCRDYAIALAAGRTALNRCPPGGAPTIAALSRVLELPVQPLDPACGNESPWPLALIDENRCIGCTKCIQACPTDAIIGTAKRMHVVIAAHCTGCELCLPPCPVDCITIVPGAGAPSPLPARERTESQHARTRFDDRARRDARRAELKEERRLAKRDEWSRDHAKELLAAALARAAAARRARTAPGPQTPEGAP